MTSDEEVKFARDLINISGYLTAFAKQLLGSARKSGSDDFVQTTLLKAWENRHQFRPGTNLKAWVFTILRNTIYSNNRIRHRLAFHAPEVIELLADDFKSIDKDQEWALFYKEVVTSMDELPVKWQDAITDVAVSGLTLKEASILRDVPIGTIKSRLFRGRKRLYELHKAKGVNHRGTEKEVRSYKYG
jgi:RNA polymerase sigma-70 factor (ECF subfamily)